MVHIRGSKNKTEELMFNATSSFMRAKRKYLVICRTGNNKPIDYVDGTKDIKFLKRCKVHIDHLIEQAEKKNESITRRCELRTEEEV